MDQNEAASQSPRSTKSKIAELLAFAEGLPDSHPRAMLAKALARACDLPPHVPPLTSLLAFVSTLGAKIRAAVLTDKSWDRVHAMLEVALEKRVSLATLRSEMAREFPLSAAREQIKAKVIEHLRQEIDGSSFPADTPPLAGPGETISSTEMQERDHRVAHLEHTLPSQASKASNTTGNPFAGPRRPGSSSGS